MADYTNAQTALDAAISNDLIEEYEISNDKRRVKRGSVKSQIETMARLNGLVSRQSGGMFRLGKLQEPSD